MARPGDLPSSQGEAGGEATAQSVSAGITGGEVGRTATNQRRKRRVAGNMLVINPGKAELKGYAVTGDELWLLGSLGVGTTLLFSVATGLVGYYVNVGLTMAFSQGVPEKVIASYETSQWWALRGAIALYTMGVMVAASSGIKVRSILQRTEHDETK